VRSCLPFQLTDITKLFERSNFSNEVGAAINVGPNAVPVLKALGFDFQGAKFMVARGVSWVQTSVPVIVIL